MTIMRFPSGKTILKTERPSSPLDDGLFHSVSGYIIRWLPL